MDYIPLTKSSTRKTKREKNTNKSDDNLDEHDDFAGVIINAGKSINVREMVIISNNNMTMSGTIYASFIMIVGVIIIDMIYR
jgi:hypothetical protein